MKRPTKFLYSLSLTLLIGLFLSVMAFAPPLARKYSQTRRYANVTEANVALTQNPRDARAFRTLADAALNAGDHRKATHEWKKAFDAEPDNEFYRVIYAPLILRDNPDEARRVLTPALQSVNPTLVAEARAMLRQLPPTKTPASPATPAARTP